MPPHGTSSPPTAGATDASLRLKVQRVLKAPLHQIDQVIRSLEPDYDSFAANNALKIEAALACIAGETAEAPLPKDPRDAAARTLQGAWRRSRKRSRSRQLLNQLVADLVSMEILSRRSGGRRLIAEHHVERANHLQAMGSVLEILAAHGQSRSAAEIADLIEPMHDAIRNIGGAGAAHSPFPLCTDGQLAALYRGMSFLSNSARQAYRVEFRQGRLHWRNAPLDTSSMKSYWSGAGSAIFVMDGEGTFYAAEQVMKVVHHSSFLSGAPVFGAGEMMVEDGVLRILTAQSGHYRPTLKEMVATMRQLVTFGVRHYLVALWAGDRLQADVCVQGSPGRRPAPSGCSAIPRLPLSKSAATTRARPSSPTASPRD